MKEVVGEGTFAVDAHVKVAYYNELGMVRRLGEVGNSFVKVLDEFGTDVRAVRVVDLGCIDVNDYDGCMWGCV